MSAKIKSLVRILLENSADEDGIIQKRLVENVLSGLKEAKPPRNREVLREYLSQVSKAIHKQKIEIEIGCNTNEELVSSIKIKLTNSPKHRSTVYSSKTKALSLGTGYESSTMFMKILSALDYRNFPNLYLLI